MKTQLESMDPPKLRALASNYVMEFLQGVEKLIVGTLEGNPALNGQTLAEEKTHEGVHLFDSLYVSFPLPP